MNTRISTFLAKNVGKSKIILVGENHNPPVSELPENVGKQALVINTLIDSREPFLIYHELPENLIDLLTPEFTSFYIKKYAEARGVTFAASKITASCRGRYGLCDDLYKENAKSYLNSEEGSIKTVVCIVGLLHAAAMNFPANIAVLRINGTSLNTTNNAVRELTRTGSPLASLISISTPYIEDATANDIGRTLIESIAPSRRSAFSEPAGGAGAASPAPAHAAAAGGAGAASPASASAATSGTFEPIYVKSRYGDCVIKCPFPSCGNESGRDWRSLTHNLDCPNKGKTPNISNKITECARIDAPLSFGGYRRKMKRKSRNNRKKNRKTRRR